MTYINDLDHERGKLINGMLQSSVRDMAQPREAYIKLAWNFLTEARRKLEDYVKTGDEVSLRQACEKGWGAVAQGLMYAVGKAITSHREFSIVASELFKKTGDRIFLRGEVAGEYLHGAGFYHGLPTLELISDSLDLIEEMLRALERLDKLSS